MFTRAGRSGVALYVADDKGGCNGMWAFRGGTRISKEKLRPPDPIHPLFEQMLDQTPDRGRTARA